MVLGFGKTEERFPPAKDQSPGPGAYDPKELATKLAPTCGFAAKDRFSVDLEDQQVKQGLPTARERKFPWCMKVGGSETPRNTKSTGTPKKYPKDAEKAPTKPEADSKALLQEKLHGYVKEILDVRKELAEEAAKRSEREQQLACLEISLETTKYELNEQKNKVAELEAAAALSCTRAAQLECELSAARAEWSGLQERLAAVQAELSAAKRQVVNLQTEVENKDTSIANTQAAAQLLGLFKELAGTKAALQQAEGALIKKDESVAHASSEIADLKKLLRSEQAVARGLTAELQARRGELEAAAVREKVLSSAKARLEERLAGEASEDRNSLSVVLALQEDVLALQQEIAARREAAAYTDARIKEMQAEDNRKLAEYEEQLVNKLKLGAEHAALTARVEEQADALSAWAEAGQQWQDAMAEKEAKQADLSAQLAADRAALQDRVDEVGRLKKAIAQRECLVTDLRCKIEQLSSIVHSRDRQISALSVELQKREAALATLESTSARLHADVAERELEFAQLRKALEDRGAALQGRDDLVSQLLADAAAATERIFSLEASLGQADSDKAAMSNTTTEMEDARTVLRQAVFENREDAASLPDQLLAAKSDLEAAAGREAKLRNQLKATENRLASAEAAANQLQQLRQQCFQLKGELHNTVKLVGELV